MAFVICGVWRNYGAGAEDGAVFLWGAEAGACGLDGNDDGGGNFDDAADYAVLLWDGVVDFGGGEFIDFADAALCDGADVYDGSSCGGAGGGGGGFVVRNEVD